MAYVRVNWQDYPSTSTPINAANLNKMDAAISTLDTEVAKGITNETSGTKSLRNYISTVGTLTSGTTGDVTTWTWQIFTSPGDSSSFGIFVGKRTLNITWSQTQWGDMYTAPISSVGYPIQFQAMPVVTAQIERADGGQDGWLSCTTAGDEWNSPAYEMVRPAAPTGGNKVVINYIVIVADQF